jgi:hypothetical protein
MVLVFGSNLAGRHGKGAALTAIKKYGAERGIGEGRTGNAYAIPTKDASLAVIPLSNIRLSVETFCIYADQHPFLQFKVTRIGCGLAGYSDNQIAPMFSKAPKNCYFDPLWQDYLPEHRTFSLAF